MLLPIIAIGGPHGSGKSSVAKRLAEDLGMNYVSAGEVFRKLADERNVSLKELSKIVMEEDEVDREIDRRTEKLGSIPNTIVDAQLAIHFTPKNIALKICITASPEVRYQRIADRERYTFDEAKTETEIREKAERQRFQTLYGLDVDDLSNYDIIVNNDRLDTQRTYNLCRALIQKALDTLDI